MQREGLKRGMLLLGFVAWGASAVSCASSGQVERRRGEVTQNARTVSPLAYAWFARGLHHERAGALKRAEHAFRATLEYDRESGAAWAALGRILCSQDRKQANQVFSQGLKKASRLAPLHVERGRCSLAAALSQTEEKSRNTLERALNDALAALVLEPKNESANRLVVESYAALGDTENARRYERAFRLFMDEPNKAGSVSPYRRIDEAIWRGDLASAQDLALTVLPPGALAARAAYWGQQTLAEQQARLVLRASPDDADAFITMLVVSGKNPGTELPMHGLSPAGIIIFSQHLNRYVSEAAALLFISQHEAQLRASDDPIAEQIANSLPQD